MNDSPAALERTPASRAGGDQRQSDNEWTPDRLPTPEQLDAALQGAKVCLFSQDRDLRYIWMSGPLCGIDSAEILDHTDDELQSLFDQQDAVQAKRHVLETGIAADSEFACMAAGRPASFSVHIEPAYSADSEIEGVVCAALEITDRKEREAQLWMLLREITHRSKNLLAVIQGMARQTARHAGTIGNFLDLFGARLQALAQSHDLLVQQRWHSADLQDLVRGQLAHHLDSGKEQIAIEGPTVALCPEAAQSVGLALHELASNAVKFGSLSRASGKVSVVWRYTSGNEVELLWTETGGPQVPISRNPGFGTLVLQKSLPRSLDADVNLDFRPDGLYCRIVLPAAQLTNSNHLERFPVAPR